MQNTDKKAVLTLTHALGDIDAVISPGSRNAPLSIAFNRRESGANFVVVDERSAAYFALGIAQKTQKPVALICTSGTSVLNYMPAVAEAYYQQIPLLVITADRPEAWIDQEDSQTIRQRDVMRNIVKASFQLPKDESEESLWHANRIANNALSVAQKGRKGPVHINVPLAEPLYKLADDNGEYIQRAIAAPAVKGDCPSEVLSIFERSRKVMILGGFSLPCDKLQQNLETICQHKNGIIVVAEQLSNVRPGRKIINCAERLFSSITEDEAELFKPELLITFGGSLVSKSAKLFFRKHKPDFHFNVNFTDVLADTFGALSHQIEMSMQDFTTSVVKQVKANCNRRDNNKEDLFADLFTDRNLALERKFETEHETSDWNEREVFNILTKSLPDDSDLHLSNGLSVRLGQFFSCKKNIRYFANRGTSGIDGSTSTAAGFAAKKAQTSDFSFTTLITGDLSFLYDSNALWNKHLPDSFKIIVINNNGGGIFRNLKGPSDLEEMREYFETPHSVNIAQLACAYGVNYAKATDKVSLNEALSKVYSPESKCSVLEIVV
ncbi:MAG: 2-succinyl-5-enolpyruvyl-6-hydroxy-3-cyclohexene-1-carboxylic-acid synthase [Paludibacteraceae bacterium]|nr:2-succinyl-5-enolpyruvyl-6-hydroxy-3-cyclohexene-1-carboxylic-acid synthase [Paludibacteraceae bacterium]